MVMGSTSCNDDNENVLPDFGTKCYKRSVSPNIVGEEIYFTYAMAVQPQRGKLTAMEVYSSIPGGEGTYIDPNSYHTVSTEDVPVLVANESELFDNNCVTSFNVDTCAATLRYYYEVPEEARGKEVEFNFIARNSLNEERIIKMGPYKISKMDIKRNILLSSQAPFFSVKNMAAYSKEQLDADPSLKEAIDLVYIYNSANNQILHSLVSPERLSEIAPEMAVPDGLNNNSKLVATWNLQDQQLSNLQWAIFVDDLDFEEIKFDTSNSVFLRIRQEAGCWIETSYGYRGYLYINTLDDGFEGITVSLKNYKL